jgi:hypothetical protein
MIKTITLATLAEATASEVFNFIAHHMLTQFEKSRGEDGLCKYRTGESKCAAGCLIADDEYRFGFETQRWRQLIAKNQVPEAHTDLVAYMQVIHDQTPVSMWASNICIAAEAFGPHINVSIEPEVQALLDLRSTK